MNKRILQILAFFFLFFIFSCNADSGKPPQADLAKLTGKELATVYCQSCHLLPDPLMIDKEHWKNGVLPQMGPRLGIFEFKGQIYPSYRGELMLDNDLYPALPAMDSASWQKILDYFNAVAPDSLAAQRRDEPIINQLPGFNVLIPAQSPFSPATGCIKFDTVSEQSRIFRSDLLRRQLILYDQDLKIIDSLKLRVGITDLVVVNSSLIVACFVGDLMPNIGRSGFVKKIFVDSLTGKMTLDSSVMFEKLARPVKLLAADMNRDNLTDYLVCEFGHMFGSLSLFEAKPDGGFEKTELQNSPGVISIQLNDYNQDGLKDIWALFTQGDERIILFTNKGNGKFEQQTVLRFQPETGSSYFELADFNKDGLQDILYTAGDNGDYSQILKPFHGVYIYINKGDNKFEKQYFFPMNGSFKAIARDYDQDGDMDIASIAYFADYAKQPEEGFVFLENEGNLRFKPFSFSQSVKGRWLTMDVADFKGDGSEDILLGNMSVGPTVVPSPNDWKLGPPFFLLENKITKNKR